MDFNPFCYLCKSIMRDSVKLPCNHLLCKTCLLHHYENNKNCPICSVHLDIPISSLIPDELLKTKLETLRIYQLSLKSYFKGIKTCSICFENHEDPKISSCNHIFCYQCIKKWYSNHKQCPSCRVDLQDPEIMSNLQEVLDQKAKKAIELASQLEKSSVNDSKKVDALKNNKEVEFSREYCGTDYIGLNEKNEMVSNEKFKRGISLTEIPIVLNNIISNENDNSIERNERFNYSESCLNRLRYFCRLDNFKLKVSCKLTLFAIPFVILVKKI